MCSLLTGLPSLIVTSRVPRGEVDTSTDAEVKGWIKKVGELKPREVLLQSVETKASKKAKTTPKTRLGEIASELTEKTGIAAHIVPGDQIYTPPPAA
jgi:hypothetical protein